MSDLSFARAWSTVAARAPEREAIVCGARRLTYADLHRRATALAAGLASRGVQPRDRVAIELVNSPEYLEAFYAAQLLGAVPVNVNYRYTGAELAYLLDNSGAAALVYHDDFGESVLAALAALDGDQPALVVVDHTGGVRIPAAACYEALLADATAASDAGADEVVEIAYEPSGDDLVFLYTGGTTGSPKAVMWRTDDLYRAIFQSARPGKEPPDVERLLERGHAAATSLPSCPLMHGTGLFTALSTLSGGGKVVLVDATHLDVEAIWNGVESEQVQLLTIVGDAFARPLLAALDEQPKRWDLSSLVAIMSSGVTWSPETKRGLLVHLPGVSMIDSLGASEGIMTRTETRAGEDIAPARFSASERLVVIADDGELTQPGDGKIGMLGVGGPIPLGYHGDPEKTASTFRTVAGKRYSVPGDYATLDADGTITLLGRGSACINTGGEKVYPEEVELALRSHPSVFDTVVLGVPDERWGEMVTAMVQLRSGDAVTQEELHDWCRERLAGYKTPKQFILLPSLRRSPSGKADYKLLREEARMALGAANTEESN